MGRRIRLREVTRGDLDAAWRWASDEAFFRYLPNAQPTRDEEVVWLESVIAESHGSPRRQYQLGIELIETGELVGMVRLGIESAVHRSASLGYGLRADQWGQGLTTEAAGLLIGFGFETLGLHRVWATHHPENLASRRILDKLGFQEEGRRRDDRYVRGRWYDAIVCSILDHEWAAPH
ncbi:MAG: GNAT family N-acetyltransferase [Chloroflexota bacterium]